MSDVLHHERLTPTQQAARDQRLRLRASMEAQGFKPVPVLAPKQPDLEISALRAALRSAQTEIDDLRKKVIDLTGDLTELKLMVAKEFTKNDRIKKIQTLVAEHYGISRGNLLSAYRGENYVRPRHVAMYLAKSATNLSLPMIGKNFGGRDHTTILHAVRKIEALRKTDTDLNATINSLAARLEVAP